MIFKKDLHKELVKIRKMIPDQYNQLEILDYLDDDDVDLIFSITTRTDGKTFNTLLAMFFLSIDLDFTTVLIVRHDQLRDAMLTQIQDVVDTISELSDDNLSITMNMDLASVYYGEHPVFYICDLNDANDLKNFSGILKNANLMIYDEFLAVAGDYTSNEFKKWKTIFETMDRGITPAMKYTNNRRKAIFLGNPVDFGSEFLAYYELYERLEKQPMNTIQKKDNILIERRKNTNAQKNKNTRIFHEDESVTGEFKINSWQLKKADINSKPIIIKTLDAYICLYYDKDYIISVKMYQTDYSFNTELEDNKAGSTYCKPDLFYKEKFYKKYTKNMFYFENQYSKDYVLQNYPKLNLLKIIRKSKSYDDQRDTFTKEEEKLRVAQHKELIKHIADQYFM